MNTEYISSLKNVEEGLKKNNTLKAPISESSSCYTGKRKSKRQIRWVDILAIVAWGGGAILQETTTNVVFF